MHNRGMPFLSLMVLGTTLLVAQQIPRHVATIPAERLSEDWWKQRHAACVALTKKGGVDVVFLGDSITQGWEGGGRATWDKEFAPLKSANFGFSGDRTEHVLWRLENGEIVGLHPKLVVVMIGTNNIGHGSSNPQQAADGVHAIVEKLLSALPGAKVLLLGIFPRGQFPADKMRQDVATATSLFKGLDDHKRVFFLDIGYAFLRSDGELRTTLMPDMLHLTSDGYEIWAQAMKPELTRLLGK